MFLLTLHPRFICGALGQKPAFTAGVTIRVAGRPHSAGIVKAEVGHRVIQLF